MPSKNKTKAGAPRSQSSDAPIRKGDSVRAAARHATAKKTGKRIKPAGSSPSKAASSPDRRPLVEPAGPPPSLPMPDLPERYGENRVTVMARDPWWLFTYWEIQPSARKAAAKKLKDQHGAIALRVYEVNGDTFTHKNIARYEDVLVNDQSSGSWYVNVWNEGAVYVVEVGMLGGEGRFVPIVRSNPLNGSLGSLSEEIDQNWVTVDRDYQNMFQLGTKHVPGELGSAGELPQGPSSMEIQRLLRRKLETELSSGAVAAFSSSAYPAHVAGEAEAHGKAKTSQFWLQVATEVILYGATEPDATLTVMGQPVQLRADGTFTLRFALPEGKFDMPVHAVSRSKEHERSITPVVERTTR